MGALAWGMPAPSLQQLPEHTYGQRPRQRPQQRRGVARIDLPRSPRKKEFKCRFELVDERPHVAKQLPEGDLVGQGVSFGLGFLGVGRAPLGKR